MKNKKKKVIRTVIIDDGFDWHVANKYGNAISQFFEVKNKKVLRQENVEEMYLSSHGTNCFAIYAETVKALSQYHVFSIKIIDLNTRLASIESLESALEWCLANKIDIISISLGTKHYQDFYHLQMLIDALVNQGTIIICAHSNDNQISYPASCKNVLGVRCDYTGNILNQGEFLLQENGLSKIDIISCCEYPEVEQLLDGDKIANYNSYAAPFIAGLVHHAMNEGNHTIPEIIAYLIKRRKEYNNFSMWKFLYNAINIPNVIDIPIVGVISSGDGSIITEICELCREFICQKYNTYLICFDEKEDYYIFSRNQLYIFGIKDLSEMIRFIYSYTQANIIFVQMNINEICDNSVQIDLLLTDTDYETTVPKLKIGKGKELVEQIKNMFA